jgi:peptide/nickel transport system substrate-binding protein
VRGSKLKFVSMAAAVAACLLVAGAATAGYQPGSALGTQANDTLLYAGAADPTYLDPALVSDGESFRVSKQIFESLVDFKPGTTKLVPSLATKWAVSKDGKTWTFQLRGGVKFHDGTPFNAAAVCANFNRWFNFSGPFQDASATFYYQAIFSGFKKNESADLGAPLYKSCSSSGSLRAVIKLNRRNGPFLASLVLSAFAIQSPTAMNKYGANQGTIRNGVFYPTGTYAFSHPTGTGPYIFEKWTVGESVILKRNASHWGRKAKLARIIIRPIGDNTARVQALQSGEVFAMDLLPPQLVGTVKRNSRLKVLSRPSFNVAYVTINQAMRPMNDVRVRKAVAYGLNRQLVVRSFYAGRAQVAHEFMPPTLFGYAPNVTKYAFNPTKAKALLKEAGCGPPCKIEFWYPTGVSRPYMPDPKANFEAFKASLEQSGFEVEAKSAPWRPDYVKHVNEGTGGHLNLIGWTGDYADPDNFIGTFFQGFNPSFGERDAVLDSLLNRAEQEVNLKKRIALYQAANRRIAATVPGVPYAHSLPALGLQKRVQGYFTSPIGTDDFITVSIGGQ